MELITSHLNADFDALASMMAARKLHPRARLVFPGSQEKQVRDFLAHNKLVHLSFDRLKDLDLARVRRLILVDTRMKGRLGALDEVAVRPGVELVIYDHHPAGAGDYRGKREVIGEVGATSTLMAETMRRRRIPLTPGEATLLALGIYEDTGSLTFASTTARDFAAAAYLFGRGARLSLIPHLLARELSSEQVEVLDRLLHSLTLHDLGGVRVGIATADVREYVGDLALVVHKLVDMKGLPVFFALVTADDRLTIIGRSRAPEISAAAALAPFGGGGHASAASAAVKGLAAAAAEERLLSALGRMAGERLTAASLMSSPVMTIGVDEPLSRAREVMGRINIHSLLATDRAGRAGGIITLGVAERAVRHGLGDSPVSEFMSTDFLTVPEDAPLPRVEEAVVERRQRLLPVVDGEGRVTGVISRTDLLQAMHEDLSRTRGGEGETAVGKAGRVKNLSEVMSEVLDPETQGLLRRAGETAGRMGARVYAVGGFVRDLLLRNANLDLDLVVEGDGIAFARRLSRSLRAHLRSHRKFGTATLVLANRRRIDVAGARTEYYTAPGAPPTVEEGSIKLDLYRRDFSINALAILLNPEGFGRVVDFFGGERDLKERTIRVLHNLSFVEDPTRILRAVRFEQRFGFRIGRHTQELLKNAVSRGYLRRAQGSRVWYELTALLREKAPAQGAARLEQLGALKAIHPALAYGSREQDLFARVEKVLAWYHLLYLPGEPDPARVYFSALMFGCTAGEREEVLAAFSLPETRAARWRVRWAEMARTARELARDARGGPSRQSNAARLLSRHPTDELLALMAVTRDPETSRLLSRFITRMRQEKAEVGGKDLVALGYPPGPLFGEILAAVQDARWDGEVKTREEELAWIGRKYPLA